MDRAGGQQSPGGQGDVRQFSKAQRGQGQRLPQGHLLHQEARRSQPAEVLRRRVGREPRPQDPADGTHRLLRGRVQVHAAQIQRGIAQRFLRADVR